MNRFIFGYMRVSTKNQNFDRQRERLLPLITDGCLFEDKLSGKDFERPQYQEMKNRMRRGDSLIITSLDRLGRIYTQIKEEWQWLSDNGINVRVLDMPILDTSEQRNDVAILVSNLTFEILSWVAENERVTIKSRQAEGIRLAKEKGVHMGRPSMKLPDNWYRVIDRWENGEITAVEAMKRLGMKSTTFYKKYNEMKRGTNNNGKKK